jgi:hypothetical protein
MFSESGEDVGAAGGILVCVSIARLKTIAQNIPSIASTSGFGAAVIRL